MPSLCVNIDHIATIRNARGGTEPDPLHAAVLCELAGAVGITFHLREDRRHIRDEDAYALRRVVKGILNMEMACTAEMVKIALKVKPDQVTFVPEKRKELTTEGGLDVVKNAKELKKATAKLMNAGISVSMFIDPSEKQIEASQGTGASHVELHTGRYCELFDRHHSAALDECELLYQAAGIADQMGLVVNAGHGLDYRNVAYVSLMPIFKELNIGHSIVARAAFVGLDTAVRDMIAAIDKGSMELNRAVGQMSPADEIDE